MTRIVGFAGVAGSGKNTAADFAVNYVGGKQYAFAAPLKDLTKDVFRFSDEQLYGPSEARNAVHTLDAEAWMLTLPITTKVVQAQFIEWLGVTTFDLTERVNARVDAWLTHAAMRLTENKLTPRWALQTLGTDVGRHLHIDIWVKATMKRIRDDAPEWAFITDVRFPNEMRDIPYLLHIRREGAGLPAGVGGSVHESEYYLAPPGDAELTHYRRAVYDNDGSLGDLDTWVRKQLDAISSLTPQ